MTPTEEKIRKWQHIRWKGRTDLGYLCKHILGAGYDWFDPLVHGPFAATLQQFPQTWEEALEKDVPSGVKDGALVWNYHRSLEERKALPGKRRTLLLDPRSFGKSSYNAKAHTIQWLLNFPDIAVAIIHAKIDLCVPVVKSIKAAFMHNERFRQIYPEYCPKKTDLKNWKNQGQFTLPNRTTHHRSEPSVYAGSIETSLSSLHFEVMKFSDIVQPQNVRTMEQIKTVNDTFNLYRNLLVDPQDWIDIEGTRYDFSDLYGQIIDTDFYKKDELTGKIDVRPEEERRYAYFVRGIYKKDRSKVGGGGQTFLPDELELPDALDEAGNFISWWPERYSTDKLEAERRADSSSDEEFATQKLNNPLATKEGKVFEIDKEHYFEISPEAFKKIPISHYELIIDTAETTKERSDYTAITLVAWSGGGRLYVVSGTHGKLHADQIVEEIFNYVRKYNCRVKIEETAFVRGLKPTINRKSLETNIWPVFEWLQRDTQTSKVERIKGLRPWYNNKWMAFLTNLPFRESLRQELSRFPKYRHDDILDTLADAFQGKDYFGPLDTRDTADDVLIRDIRRMQGWDPSDDIPPVGEWNGL